MHDLIFGGITPGDLFNTVVSIGIGFMICWAFYVKRYDSPSR